VNRDGQQIGTRQYPPGLFNVVVADFAVPTKAGTYRLVYDEDATGPANAFPISTHNTTAWTFRSSAPPGATTEPVPLLALDYALPLDTANHPTGTAATFTVRQPHGVAVQRITSLAVWASVDNGRKWTSLPVSRAGSDRFTAQLPQPVAGQNVSLRVDAAAAGGSAIDQTIIDAYHVPN